ncbi:hypothetical protein NNJEOMEG_03741 [Fundidesulfovibrio magnetotacticus]|uniref:Uncharacterized protein n=1 Tax=Fundidesulfovibrio magnetotacticus TaxID=2730080 RepID=A0A6V8M078_9BACT|nr:hypothetical protein NNJEOMEG_03741 [Fundidesulfovibrio magnetotacticus]
MPAGKTVIVIREEDVTIRKKQAPPSRAQRDRTVYTRKEKHRRSRPERNEETPGRQGPPGVFVLLRGGSVSRSAAPR